MPTLSYAQSLGSISKAVNRTGDTKIDTEISLPAGKSGTLTTRTDANTGVVTVASGHGIVDTDTVDVYWATGRRYNVDVTAVTSTTISIDLGSGDDLPSANEAVVICKQVTFNVAIDGDELEVLGILYDVAATTGFGCRVQLLDSGAAVIASHDLDPNTPVITDVAAGVTNPYTGNPITNGKASNGDGSNAAVLKFQGIVDATP